MATDRPVVDALRALITAGLPGIVAYDGERYIVVPASQVLRVALPSYVRDDPSLARVWDEASADALSARLAELTVEDLLTALDMPTDRPDTAVPGDATLVEVAATLTAAHVPLVAVVGETGEFLGVVTANALAERLLG